MEAAPCRLHRAYSVFRATRRAAGSGVMPEVSGDPPLGRSTGWPRADRYVLGLVEGAAVPSEAFAGRVGELATDAAARCAGVAPPGAPS